MVYAAGIQAIAKSERNHIINGFDFEIFHITKRKRARGEMSVYAMSNQLYISAEASKFLTEEYVEIGYDKQKKAIAIQPTERTDSSKKICKQGSGKSLSSRQLMRLIRKEAGERKKFSCRWDQKGKMLIFNL